ncbi:MAG TPA: hypothetical protein VK158_05830, partial [Acidobacteriota bacterium]|nr:hypothetical protein [Acidobacteriota bacterium]
MAFVMSSVDLYFLTKELSSVLKDAKVDQIYHPDQLTLKIRFYCPGAGKREIFFATPQAIYDGADVSM